MENFTINSKKNIYLLKSIALNIFKSFSYVIKKMKYQYLEKIIKYKNILKIKKHLNKSTITVVLHLLRKLVCIHLKGLFCNNDRLTVHECTYTQKKVLHKK